jgi:multiple sugar transport system substrate-binding protein
MNSKKVSRRDFLKVAAVSAAGAALTACQPAATQQAPSGSTAATNTPAAAANPPSKQKAKITFSMYGHPGLIEQMVPIFNETHDDVELVFERSEGQGYWQKLTAALAAGTAWDCFRGDMTHAVNWGPKGAILDVKNYMDMDKKYPMSDYIPGIIEDYTVQGKIYGVPTWCLTLWMFYNKKMFDEAGIKYPDASTTWTDYLQMAKKLTKKDGDKITQYGANGWNSWTFPIFQVVWSNGGHMYYDDSMTKVEMDDPKTIEVFQMLADMWLVDKVIPNPNAPASSPIGLLSDNVATQADGDYMPGDNLDTWTKKYDYLDATLPPSFNGNRSNVYWPDSFQINSKTKYPEACYAWMAWFARDPDATAIQGKIVFPTYTKAYTDDSIASKWLSAPYRPKGMIEAAKEHVKNAKLVRFEPHTSAIDTIYYNEIGKLWSGEGKAEDVLKKINTAANEEMSKPAS